VGVASDEPAAVTVPPPPAGPPCLALSDIVAIGDFALAHATPVRRA
jgi:hypothetical protein